jgi:hypothetical protein
MASNKLMEAAADILSGSKKSAPAMPPEKLDGEMEVVGGPTPENYKNDDDSAKLKVSAKVDKSAHNRSTIATKPSKASAKMEESEVDGEVVSEQEEFSFEDDINAMFADDSTISEDFKSKAATIFEARVYDRISQIQEQMESEYAGMLEEAVEQIKEDLTTKVDDYLNYVVEQWIEQNEIAIESGLRAELTEEFIAGLRNLFAEHYIDVPTEKVDLVDELATKVEELESKLDEEIERGVELKKALIESRKVEIAHEVCESLTATQVEKIKSLAESVEFFTEEEYKDKLETIRENYFPSGVKKAAVAQLHEQVEDGTEEKKVIFDPFVAAVSQAISKTKL